MPHATTTTPIVRFAAAPRTTAWPARESEDAGGLDAYFRRLAEVEVMSKEAELAAAVRIAERRHEFWTALLGSVSVVARICELAPARLSLETCPAEAVAAMQGALDRADAGAIAAARAALAEALALADVDGVMAEPILAGLAKLDDDAHYRASVRAAHAALVAAKNAFVKANLRLVVAIARTYAGAAMPLQDLIQEGNLGLMKAVDRFDHRRGCRFSTYGAWWIRHAIGRSLTDKGRSVRVPAHLASACRKVRRVSAEFEVLHGRRPSEDEVMALTGVTAGQIERMRWAPVEEPMSLDQPLSAGGNLTLLDTLGDEAQASHAEALEFGLMQGRLEQAFAALSPIEVEVLRARAGMDEDAEATLRVLGERLSLSRERVRQIHEQGLKKLRRAFMRRAA